MGRQSGPSSSRTTTTASRYDRHPVGAVQPLAPEHVAYLGTASKTLVPGLRLAWMALPAYLVDDVTEAKRSPTAEQRAGRLALAELIRSGGYNRTSGGHAWRTDVAATPSWSAAREARSP